MNYQTARARRVPRVLIVAAIAAVLSAGLAHVNAATSAPLVADVRYFGASGDGITNDTAAIQRANDAVAKLGGGTVYFPPGTYMAAGIAQDSGVEFSGTTAAVLKHPNGVNPTSIIKSRRSSTSGSIARASRTLLVDNNYRMQPGANVAIRGAGGASAVTTTTTTAPVNVTSSSISAGTAGFPSSGFVQIDNEAVFYGSLTSSGFTDVVRGVWGTSAAAHGQGAAISLSTYLYASVVAVSGNTVTIDRDARFGVTSTEVNVGAVNVAVRNLTLDGNKPTTGVYTSTTVPVEYLLASGATVSGNTIRNGIHGGVRFDLGTTHSTIENNTFTDNGRPFERLGSAIWMFRGSSLNTVRGNTINGTTFWGITMDDRTEVASEWDASSDGNLVESNVVDYPAYNMSVGIFVTGCSSNILRNNIVNHMQTGIAVDASPQGTHPLDAQHNSIIGNTLSGLRTGVHVSGSFNTFAGNVVSSTTIPGVNLGKGNTFAA